MVLLLRLFDVDCVRVRVRVRVTVLGLYDVSSIVGV